MINAKELRLSNWVLDSEGVERQVTVISAQGRVFLPPVKYVDRMPKILKLGEDCSTDLIHPIPLTPEVLEACGFENREMWFYKERFCLGYITTDLHFQLEWKIDEIEGGWNLLDIKYLHQLQNIYFALTGQELEYKNK